MALEDDCFKLSSKGGVLEFWRVGGKDILFPQQKLDIGGETKLRGGMFWCFPNFGRPADKYDLPRHGPLRDKEGDYSRDAYPIGSLVEFNDRKDLLGKSARSCSVVVSARYDMGLNTDDFDAHNISYRISAHLPRARTARVPLLLGAHPYFATPQGSAVVHVGGNTHLIGGLIDHARFVPWSGEATIVLPGVGTVEMRASPSLVPPASGGLFLWRDDVRYVCVEPVMGQPERYGDLSLGCLRGGKTTSGANTASKSFSATVSLRLRV